MMKARSLPHRSARRILTYAVAASCLIAAASSQAQWSENFDSYASGSQVIGQGGWQGWDGSTTVGALVSATPSFSSPNSIRIYGTSTTPPANYSDLVHKFSGYTSGTWIFSARQYIPSSATSGTSYFILLDRYADNATDDNWAIQTSFDLAAGNLVEEQGPSSRVNIVRDQWVELRYEINLTANTVSAYYNGTRFSTHPWQTNGINQIQAIDLYSDVSGPVYYDNLSLALDPTTVTTTAGTGAGSLSAAIAALKDGDTLRFNIPGAGPHYIQVPPDGFPLITKNNVTIDGYTQLGASPNTASIHATNNAVLKIVLTATNGNALSMQAACESSWGAPIPRLGYGNDEQAILGFFHATNVVIRGLVFQSTPFTATSQAPPDPTGNPANGPFCKGICFAANSAENGGGMCENWRISGCWFGVDPVTRQVAFCQDPLYGVGTLVASPAICVASYRTRDAAAPDNPVYNRPGTIGVAARSATPRADFNVFVTGYGYDSEGMDYRFSGNFFGVLPDGVTSADMGVLSPLQQSDGYLEIGRNDSNLIIGTDGDGVNDDQEGNVFGPMTVSGVCINLYSDPRTNIVVAGNYFSVDINGNPFSGANTNLDPIIDTLGNVSTLRFGSDFNGVSDALEGNKVANTRLFKHDNLPALTNTTWVSMRGNSLLNCTSFGYGTPPLGDGNPEHANIYAGFVDTTIADYEANIIPVIGPATMAGTLVGKCGLPVGPPYTNIVIDVYEADTTDGAPPQGKKWLGSFADNSPADLDPAVGTFKFDTTALGIASGKQVTITATYTKDTNPVIGIAGRTGTQTQLRVTGGTGQGPVITYGVQKALAAAGPYSYVAAAVGGLATFTDAAAISFYRATGPSATGETTPFSLPFTIP